MRGYRIRSLVGDSRLSNWPTAMRRHFHFSQQLLDIWVKTAHNGNAKPVRGAARRCVVEVFADECRNDNEGMTTMNKRNKAKTVRIIILLCAPLLLVGALAADSAIAANASPTTVPSSSNPFPSSPGPSAPVVPHPTGVPTGPVSSLAACPSSPSMSSPLPAGATVSEPSLAPAGVHTTANGISTDYAGSCIYTVTIPSSDLATSADASPALASPNYIHIIWINGGNHYAPVGAVYGPEQFYNEYGDICYTNLELVNWAGFAYAGLELLRGHCNTDSSGIWSNVTAVNGSFYNGATTSVGTFGSMQWAAVPGNIFMGEYAVCIEDPLGQQSSFWCWDTNYGPFF
jgi:hypothetical protein